MRTLRSRAPRSCRLASLALVALLGLPGTALAAGSPTNGVHADPGSPAGKEYAIPLSSAGGGSGASSGGSLFGRGITKASTTASHTASGATVSGHSSASTKPRRHAKAHHAAVKRGPATQRTAANVKPATIPSPAASLHPSGNGGLEWMALAAAAVLAVGAAGAYVVASRSRRRQLPS
jgi:hypothetical protein